MKSEKLKRKSIIETAVGWWANQDSNFKRKMVNDVFDCNKNHDYESITPNQIKEIWMYNQSLDHIPFVW